MINNNRIRPFIFIFLLFCVLSSKNIIIFNEETLVAGSFFLFILFIFHYFGETIKESLNERNLAIKNELQSFLNIKKNSLNFLFKEHNKISLLNKVLIHLKNTTNSEIQIYNVKAEKITKFITYNQIIAKIKALVFFKKDLQQQLQQLVAKDLLIIILVQYYKLKQNTKKDKSLNILAIKNAVKLLINL